MARLIFGPDYDRRCTGCGQWLRYVRSWQRVTASHDSGRNFSADHCGSRYCEAWAAAYAAVKLAQIVAAKPIHQATFVHRVAI